MTLRPYGRILVGLSAALLVAVPGLGRAQDRDSKGDSASSAKKTAAREHVSGVITKVEKIEKKSSSNGADRKEASRTVRLTINTAAVWRDWAHDQTTQSASASAKKEAAEGANSIATKGEPADKNTLVVVDLTSDSNVETRFRALDDESSKGSKTPEGAREDSAGKGKHESAKPTRFDAAKLMPGLFVEADLRHTSGQERVSNLCVIRPVAETGTTRTK